MRRKGVLLFLALVLVAAILAVLWLLTPPPPVAEKPVPPPVPKPRTPLQPDAEGHYTPGYAFTVSRPRFTGFTLRPEAFVTFRQPRSAEQVACLRAPTVAT